MEKKTVFIKRYPSKGEFPKKEGFYLTNKGKLHTDNFKSWFIEYWLEEIELPSEEEISKMKVLKDKPTNIDLQRLHGFKSGANFILNHLKSNTNMETHTQDGGQEE